MGVGSGYTQTDVTQARLYPDRLVDRGAITDAAANPARSRSTNARMSRWRRSCGTGLYMQDGVAQGEAALDDLAREPATADHIAFKFARHFVADDPPPALTKRLASVFPRDRRRSQGRRREP